MNENVEQKSNVRILDFDEVRAFIAEHPEIIEEQLRKEQMKDYRLRFGLPEGAILVAGNDRYLREEFIAAMALSGEDWKPEMLVVAPKLQTLDIVEEVRKLNDEMVMLNEPLEIKLPPMSKMVVKKWRKPNKKFFVPDRILLKRKRK